MFVARLRLVNFRGYRDAAVEFGPGLNVIVGPNASGKTNLLEGAFFALRASSPRTTREEKAVRWGAAFARAEATVGGRGGEGSHTLTVAYAPGQGKQVRVDGVETASLDDLRRQGSVFIFVPESLLLVKGSPARRRAHLDAFAAALDPDYEAGLRDLNVVLKQRNAHLWRVRDGAPADSLDAWDRQLARVALTFEERRRALVSLLAVRFREFAAALAPDGGEFSLSLVSQLDGLGGAPAGSHRESVIAAEAPVVAAEAPVGVPAAAPHRAPTPPKRPSWPPCGSDGRARSGARSRGSGRIATICGSPKRPRRRGAARALQGPAAMTAAARRATCGSSGRRVSSGPRYSPCCWPSAPSPPTRPATSALSCSTT